MKKKITISVEQKLKSLYDLQCVDSDIDQLRIVRGELPVEIQDLEDEIIRLESRIGNITQDISSIKQDVKERKESIKNAKELIKKYNKQLENIKNNREFTSLTKEVEFQELDIELSEKKINEFKARSKMKSRCCNRIRSIITTIIINCSERVVIDS